MRAALLMGSGRPADSRLGALLRVPQQSVLGFWIARCELEQTAQVRSRELDFRCNAALDAARLNLRNGRLVRLLTSKRALHWQVQ
jgi:hypothetical protein